ncbi:unnamed protein product [Meloidogyne enterolobii]|uniref:Uncharacterized protein n=1 Tax=Meloidogyne enterolobii TaxID=390850 RepID=A0ACB0ZTS0_MELEN
MLGGNNNALAELFSGQHFATSSGHEQQLFGSGGGGGGKFTSGGSPNKDDTYCEICNKNLCNRYFLKIHMNKKHGIGERSPVKLGNSNFFNYQISTSTEQQQQNSQQLPGRAQSATLLNTNRRESPPINSFNNSKTSIQKQEELQQFLCSSTPASVNNNNNLGGGGSTNNSAANSSNLLETSPNAADSFSTDQQLMGQCLMQHLASQLGLSSSQSGGERSSIIEQLIGAGLPLAELLQQQQQSAQRSSPSPDLNNQIIHCTQCARQFPTPTALLHHQITEHIGTNLEQPNNENNNNQLNPLALRWAMNELNNSGGSGDGSGSGGGGGGGDGTTAATVQQQQQFLNQLLGSNFSPNSAASSLLLPAFGALNNTEMDNATMLAKLSAELASVSQASQQQHGSSGLLFQNGLSLGQSGQVGVVFFMFIYVCVLCCVYFQVCECIFFQVCVFFLFNVVFSSDFVLYFRLS